LLEYWIIATKLNDSSESIRYKEFRSRSVFQNGIQEKLYIQKGIVDFRVFLIFLVVKK